MSKKYIDEISGFPILADKVKNGFTGVSHDNTLSGNGTDELPLGVITSGPAFTGVEHDETLSGNGTNESPLGVTIDIPTFTGVEHDETLSGNGTDEFPLGITMDIPVFTGVEHDTNLSGNGTNNSPLGVADPILLKNSLYSATYANNSANFAYGKINYSTTTPSGVNVYGKTAGSDIVTTSLFNSNKLEFDYQNPNDDTYTGFALFGPNRVNLKNYSDTKSAEFEFNNSPYNQSSLMMKYKVTMADRTEGLNESYSEYYGDGIRITNRINSSSFYGNYCAGFSYQRSICSGYSSENYIMNSNSGVLLPSAQAALCDCNMVRGYLEVRGGPSGNTMGISGTQISPNNVLCWKDSYARSRFSQFCMYGMYFWDLAITTGSPLAYITDVGMQFYHRGNNETITFSFDDLKKLKQMINNATV